MEQIAELLKTLGLGQLEETPTPVFGGLLHKMYRARTKKGIYAVKRLNAEIMKRPEALGNMLSSERIAQAFAGEIPAVAALSVKGRQVHAFGGTYYMVYPWVEGKSVFPGEIGVPHCRKVGELLGKMHRKNLKPEGLSAQADAAEQYDWEDYARLVKQQGGQAGARQDWAECFLSAFDQIRQMNKQACGATAYLAERLVVSHRDLDPKKILWQGEAPFVIDWEAAGYVNPYQEFVETINYWAAEEGGGLVREHFDAFADAYCRYAPLSGVDWGQVFSAGTAGMLGWLAYNIRRALGMEAEDEAERALGREQVKGTVQELCGYAARAGCMQAWLLEKFLP